MINHNKNITILYVGAGGLGNAALPYIMSLGLKELIILDNDHIEKNNLNRQLLYNINDINKYKVDTIYKVLRKINSHTKLSIYPRRLLKENISIINKCDIVVDGSDSIATTLLLNQACKNKYFIYGSVLKSEGQAAILSKNSICYTCIYPDFFKYKNLLLGCNRVGVSPTTCAIIGAIQSDLVLNCINNMYNQSILYIYKSGSSYEKIILNGICRCKNMIQVVEWKEYLKMNNSCLIDIRDINAYNKGHLENAISIPSGKDINKIKELSNQYDNVIIYCYKGNSSAVITAQMMKLGVNNISSLDGGYSRVIELLNK